MFIQNILCFLFFSYVILLLFNFLSLGRQRYPQCQVHLHSFCIPCLPALPICSSTSDRWVADRSKDPEEDRDAIWTQGWDKCLTGLRFSNKQLALGKWLEVTLQMAGTQALRRWFFTKHWVLSIKTTMFCHFNFNSIFPLLSVSEFERKLVCHWGKSGAASF